MFRATNLPVPLGPTTTLNPGPGRSSVSLHDMKLTMRTRTTVPFVIWLNGRENRVSRTTATVLNYLICNLEREYSNEGFERGRNSIRSFIPDQCWLLPRPQRSQSPQRPSCWRSRRLPRSGSSSALLQHSKLAQQNYIGPRPPRLPYSPETRPH